MNVDPLSKIRVIFPCTNLWLHLLIW